MGSACTSSGSGKANRKAYDIHSSCFADHYTTGETLGKGAFGVVKICALKPQAREALKDLDAAWEIPTGEDKYDDILRRQKFENKALAVKIMRQAMESTEG